MTEPNMNIGNTDLANNQPRRRYKRPEIRSAAAYERLALACTGAMMPFGEGDCGTVKEGPGGSCSQGCMGS